MKWIVATASCCYLFGAFGRPLIWTGAAIELGYCLWRGISLGRLPLIGPHDTLIFFSLSIAVMYLAVSRGKAAETWSWLTAGCGMSAGLFSMLSLPFPVSLMPMPMILDTLWFELHVVLAFFGYALFMVGAVLSAGFLLNKDRRIMDVQNKACLAGYSFFSASMVSGGIWGYYAWGTYWLWTPKELWTSILWLFYSLMLHIRFKGASGDRIAAWLGFAGAAITIFTYLGVSMLMKSSHSF